ncbi:enoyl-CoA hydratase/isomerase family protein [Pseudomonas schmalbachii]|uniref:Enoyl-CoA hydratase/isomerase family protein n=1 Tax=Pseudomonas schmalbachii TaxID=2816993 RepID=A0ABS3TPS6_9PSED|nr:enoyl-CoA hydratase-related protein [Pseudomonas schmalbachii]MBO3275665.1 enoyl-CoA hydratase/isomerase family protein [Pseudomonas schmalbachii]
MDYSKYQAIKFSQEGRVLTVTLNQPESLNAVSSILHTELSQVFADIAQDKTVDAVVLTGAGRAFSAGGDLSWFHGMPQEDLDRLFVEARKIIIDILELPQPLITAVNGLAVGLGCTIALFGDSVFAADNAKLSDPHVAIGVTAGDGGSVIWPLLVGPARAKRYLMSGDVLTAAEAERIGLVTDVVPADELVAKAQAFAQRLASGSQIAIRSTKASVNKILRDTANLVLDYSLAAEKECFTTQFHKDAIANFLAKSKR